MFDTTAYSAQSVLDDGLRSPLCISCRIRGVPASLNAGTVASPPRNARSRRESRLPSVHLRTAHQGGPSVAGFRSAPLSCRLSRRPMRAAGGCGYRRVRVCGHPLNRRSWMTVTRCCAAGCALCRVRKEAAPSPFGFINSSSAGGDTRRQPVRGFASRHARPDGAGLCARRRSAAPGSPGVCGTIRHGIRPAARERTDEGWARALSSHSLL